MPERFKYFIKYLKCIRRVFKDPFDRHKKGYKKYLMVEIKFRDNKIQKGHRIKIPKAIIDTLDLKEGTKIQIIFDPVKKRLIVEEQE